MNVRQFGRLLQETVQEWNTDNASRLAASLAYYTVFSIAPLLIIVIAIAGSVFGQQAARNQIAEQIQGLVGRDGADLIQTIINNADQPGSNAGAIASLISIGVLIFGATGVFAELQDALNTIWGVKPKPGNAVTGFVRKRVLSFAMVLSIGFLLLVSLVISAALAALTAFTSSLLPGFDPFWQVVNFTISLSVITLLFALIFKYLPDAIIAWSDVWIGAGITALLFTLGKFLIGLYLGSSSFASAYGAAGSVIIVLAWIYYSAQILFFGAEFTQVFARRYGSRIMPDIHAVPAGTKPTVEPRNSEAEHDSTERRDRPRYRRPSNVQRWIRHRRHE